MASIITRSTVRKLISNGGIADFYVVFVRTGEAPGARGITALIVDTNTIWFRDR